jgi:pyruvate/2-oxoglutarate dehydrogenase complex dihydrolipoamide acyltransferase (E2) component
VRRAVAAAVTRSHRDIPAAFCAAQVDLDPALSLLRGLSEEAVVDLPALVVKAIGLLHEQFPAFFGSVSPEGEFRPAPGPDVAVTVDAGNGLFLPVVREAHRRDLHEVADMLMEYRMLALEDGFTDAQLRDPAISVSLNLVDGITLVQPLVMPPQLCMVSVSGVVRTPRLGPGRTLTEASTTTVGLAYDHRFIDGSAATSFLSGLRQLIAQPERVL